ncbi:MAG: adenine deaminase [Clostridia bacterium]|nr:adenine deaminase [Clostridia bacterium]
MVDYDLIFNNCIIADVINLRFISGDVAVKDGIICAVGGSLGKGIDCGGAYLLPSFIDAHTHIESSLLTPVRFAEAVLPCGVTTVIADPHEIANVCGMAGIDYMIEQAARTPLDVKMMMPSCVPASDAESSGAILNAADVSAAMARADIFGLGEMMNYPAVLSGDREVIAKIDAARLEGKAVDGHYPLGSGDALISYAAAGITSDHESVDALEAIEKLRAGIDVFIREGSAGKQLEAVLPAAEGEYFGRVSLCTDDCNVSDILKCGHINRVVARAIALGMEPIRAIAMATINPARHYALSDRGAIAAGRRADIVLIRDINEMRPYAVYKDGVIVARDGIALCKTTLESCAAVLDTVKMPPLTADKLRFSSAAADIGIAINAGSLITDAVSSELCDNKLCVCERHSGSGRVGVCGLSGYGVKGGAVALSVSHDAHNIVCAGDNDTDMCVAVNALIASGGGMCAVRGGKVERILALPIAGLMSDMPPKTVAQELDSLNDFCRSKLHINPNLEPVMSLSFLALSVIPHIKLTDRGLFDVDKFKHM